MLGTQRREPPNSSPPQDELEASRPAMHPTHRPPTQRPGSPAGSRRRSSRSSTNYRVQACLQAGLRSPPPRLGLERRLSRPESTAGPPQLAAAVARAGTGRDPRLDRARSRRPSLTPTAESVAFGSTRWNSPIAWTSTPSGRVDGADGARAPRPGRGRASRRDARLRADDSLKSCSYVSPSSQPGSRSSDETHPETAPRPPPVSAGPGASTSTSRRSESLRTGRR